MSWSWIFSRENPWNDGIYTNYICIYVYMYMYMYLYMYIIYAHIYI